MAPTDTFPLFSSLPPELRFKIWTIAFAEPVTVGFSSEMDESDRMEIGKKPILHPDQSGIALSCKEAWRTRRATHVLAKFTTYKRPTLYKTAWVDFSNTVFYAGYGYDSLATVETLAPNPKIESVAILWSSYTQTIETYKKLGTFESLRRVILLVAPWQDLGDFERVIETGIDFHGSGPSVEEVLRRPSLNLDLSMYVGTPLEETDVVKKWFESFVKKQAMHLRRAPPVIETVVWLST